MVLVLLLIFGLIFSIRSCQQRAVETKAEAKAKKEALAKEREEEKRIQEEHTLHMVAVGDHFYHSTVIEDGQQESGEWNYDYIYQHVKEQIETADLAVVNQETPIVSSHDDTSGYPTFGMPKEGGQALPMIREKKEFWSRLLSGIPRKRLRRSLAFMAVQRTSRQTGYRLLRKKPSKSQ